MKRLLLCAMLAACGPASVPTVQAPRRASHAEIDRFVADENRLLTIVAAADARVAARGIAVDADTLHHAAMGGILAEDPTLAMEGDRPDVFSFDARARALDAAEKILAKWTTPPDDPDATMQPTLELELLHRFVASEKLRLAGERHLPRSASTLLVATATTMSSDPALRADGRPVEVKDVSERDDWLAQRLGDVTSALAPHSLTALEREELEDALDPLEHTVGDALPKSRAALVDLRIAVQRLEPADKNDDRWAEVAARVQADTGSKLSPETLLALLGSEAKSIRDEVGRLVGVQANEAVGERAGEWLTAAPALCHTASPGSRMRALEPPPERAFGCSLRDRLIAAQTAADELDVLVAMHDAVLTATWALVLARGGTDETIALAAPKPLTPMSPTVEGRLRRFAAVHPVEAISRALSIEWLMRNGLAEAALRADAWRTFGEAPLDIIDRELHPGPREKNRLLLHGR